MRRWPSTRTKRVLWLRPPSTLFNLKALRPRSLRRAISPVGKYQRSGSALKWAAYLASTGGVAWAGSTVKLTSFNSGVTWVEFWMPRIWWLIMGQGPSQVVKMKLATQIWPSREWLSKGWPVCWVSWNWGIWPKTGRGFTGTQAESRRRVERTRGEEPIPAPDSGSRGQTGLPADFRQKAPEIHGSLVSPRRARCIRAELFMKLGGAARGCLRCQDAAGEEQRDAVSDRHDEAQRGAWVGVGQAQRMIEQRHRIGHRIGPHDRLDGSVRGRHREKRSRDHPAGHEQQHHDAVKCGGRIHSPCNRKSQTGEGERDQEHRRDHRDDFRETDGDPGQRGEDQEHQPLDPS